MTRSRRRRFVTPHSRHPGVGAGKPVYQAIAMDEGGAAVVAVLAVRPGAAGANPANDQQLVASFAQRHSQADFAAYLAEMQRRGDGAARIWRS